MHNIKSFKEIEDGSYELVVTAGADIPSGYLLTLSREGYMLVYDTDDIILDGELCDIYYFEKCNKSNKK